MKRRISEVAEWMDEWPSLNVVVRLLPWTWRLLPRLYHDDNGLWGWLAYGNLEWLMFNIEWFCNRPPFTEFFTDASRNERVARPKEAGAQ